MAQKSTQTETAVETVKQDEREFSLTYMVLYCRRMLFALRFKFHKSWHFCFFFYFNSIYPPHIFAPQPTRQSQVAEQFCGEVVPVKRGRTPSEKFTSESAPSGFREPLTPTEVSLTHPWSVQSVVTLLLGAESQSAAPVKSAGICPLCRAVQ